MQGELIYSRRPPRQRFRYGGKPVAAELISDVASKLELSGISPSRLNAEIILSSILRCRIIDLYTEEISLSENQIKQLNDMARRRINGEPLQYIVGKVNFYGYELFIKPGVFIPRPETEVLVEVVLSIINDGPSSLDRRFIFDLGTGSGNIAISLAKALTNCRIIGSDISEEALSLAEQNAIFHGVSDRIEFIRQSLFDIPKRFKKRFDIIVSNPPYIASDAIEQLPREVQEEPREALDGKERGLYFYLAIIKKAHRFLKERGFIALELADGLSNNVRKLVKGSQRFFNINIYNDLNGIERVITAQDIGR